jgi:hypothetical protein
MILSKYNKGTGNGEVPGNLDNTLYTLYNTLDIFSFVDSKKESFRILNDTFQI